MAFQLGDTILRPLLHADIETAWGEEVEINDSPALLPGTSADLPRVFVELGDVTPEWSKGTAGLSESSVPHIYTITAQFAWPASGTLEAFKVSQINALAAALTANGSFYGNYQRVAGYPIVRFPEPSATDANEPYFSVEIDFGIEFVTDL